MVNSFIEKFLHHIENWKRFWFGLIFIGSVFNAIAEQTSYLANTTNFSIWAFALGGLIGLIAKYRGDWL